MSITRTVFNKFFITGLSAIVLAASVNMASAQTETPATAEAVVPEASAAPDSSNVASKNWLKLCNTLDDGKKACFLRQLKQNGDQFAGSFVLRDDPLQENRLTMIVAVPLGVLLPFGLRLQIDQQKPFRLPYLACDPQTCAAQAILSEKDIAAFKRGNILRLTAKNRRNKDYVVEIDLAGFTATYDGEGIDIKSLRQQTTQPASSQNQALEQKLADEAEKIRRDKEAEKAKAETTTE